MSRSLFSDGRVQVDFGRRPGRLTPKSDGNCEKTKTLVRNDRHLTEKLPGELNINRDRMNDFNKNVGDEESFFRR
jgi:hypothetical protein